MSGRVKWRRDGEIVTGYRKTDRRNPRRDPREKLHELAASGSGFDVRMVLRLPKSLEGFVAPGPHGFGVQVLAGGFVRVGSHSGEQCFISARDFFRTVARDRPAFTTQAVIISASEPDRTYARHLTVIRGSMVVSAGLLEPRIYEAA